MWQLTRRVNDLSPRGNMYTCLVAHMCVSLCMCGHMCVCVCARVSACKISGLSILYIIYVKLT